jgi:hypothetical protein
MQAVSTSACCLENVHARGMCRSYYEKWLRHNNPEYAERQRENCKQWSEKNAERKKEYEGF